MLETATKERPILMHARSIKGILERRKMQTRRIVKRRDGERPLDFHDGMFWFADGEAFEMVCPYGKPGDRLWVRETFYCDDFRYPTGPVDDMKRLLYYRADVPSGRFEDAGYWSEPGSYWKPSIHMPRWASRLTLEITDIRVERVQDISEEDCQAEGITHNGLVGYYCEEPTAELDGVHRCNWPAGFRDLWDATNGKGAWHRNDWVWVVSFRRIEC